MTLLTDTNGSVVYNQTVTRPAPGYGHVSTKVQAQQWAEQLFRYALKQGR